ncbi:MAG: hypothetical protein LBG72_07515, partial [Spirochaetaceae bacterium]|nr:hypothetical protein [Spirochaetaceae bacterium]
MQRKMLIIGLALVAFSVLSVTGCAKKSGGDYKVGYIVGSREHVFYTLIEKGIKDNAQANGVNAIVMDGNLDGKVTSDHIENFVADKMKAIALSANDPGGT